MLLTAMVNGGKRARSGEESYDLPVLKPRISAAGYFSSSNLPRRRIATSRLVSDGSLSSPGSIGAIIAARESSLAAMVSLKGLSNVNLRKINREVLESAEDVISLMEREDAFSELFERSETI
jgi:hypothetical protein